MDMLHSVCPLFVRQGFWVVANKNTKNLSKKGEIIFSKGVGVDLVIIPLQDRSRFYWIERASVEQKKEILLQRRRFS